MSKIRGHQRQHEKKLLQLALFALKLHWQIMLGMHAGTTNRYAACCLFAWLQRLYGPARLSLCWATSQHSAYSLSTHSSTMLYMQAPLLNPKCSARTALYIALHSDPVILVHNSPDMHLDGEQAAILAMMHCSACMGKLRGHCRTPAHGVACETMLRPTLHAPLPALHA